MEIKLIALDMDGTLLDNDHATVPERNVRALREAAARGIRISIASGRAWCLVEDVVRGLGVVDYAVLANGASVLDVRTGEWLLRTGMPRAQSRAILRLLLERDIPFEAYCAGKSYMQRSCGAEQAAQAAALSPAFARVLLEHITMVDDLEGALRDGVVEKFNIFHIEGTRRQELLAAIGSTGPYSSASSTATNLEITAPDADKGAALSRLCTGLGIPAGAVMAFGDAENDLGMLTWAGWSFAMGNADARARAAARYVTGANSDGGVGQAIEAHILSRGAPDVHIGCPE